MSYQRWTQGDAYVIGTDDTDPVFHCVGCTKPYHKTYADIIRHLETDHHNSNLALSRLREEAAQVGVDKTWQDFLDWERAHISKP